MKVLISPAKLLDYSKEIKVPKHSIASFIDDADYLAGKLKAMPKEELKNLMKLSENLADVNHQRYQKWTSPTVYNENSKPAITVFNGEVFKGFDAESLSQDELNVAQDTVRILSGIYGILKPLDLIYPYRLEMGTRWQISPKVKNLYSYWGTRLSDFLNKEMQEGEVIINLASNEYFKAIDKKVLKARIITPVFKELRGDEFKVVMMYAKRARGEMARDIVQNQYKDPEDLKGYNVDGYSFSHEMSNESEWTFIR